MHEMTAALDIIMEAGKRIVERRAGQFGIALKGSIDYVTDIDRDTERYICGKLREAFPEDGILSEEGSVNRRSGGRRWILDPVDGTTNLIKGYPFIAISLALETANGIALGIVYNPVLNELFAAEKGKGATLGGSAITAGTISDLSKSVLASGFPYDIWESEDDNTSLWRTFLKSCISCRCDGSAALDICRVACGQLDGYWEKGLAPWDMAAGIVIAEEAGCIITDYAGRGDCLTKGEIVVANSYLHEKMLEIINGK